MFSAIAPAVSTPLGPAPTTTTANVPRRSAASRVAAALSSAPSIAEDRLVASSTEYSGYASSRAPGVSKKLGSDPVASTRIRPRYVSPSSVVTLLAAASTEATRAVLIVTCSRWRCRMPRSGRATVEIAICVVAAW